MSPQKGNKATNDPGQQQHPTFLRGEVDLLMGEQLPSVVCEPSGRREQEHLEELWERRVAKLSHTQKV